MEQLLYSKRITSLKLSGFSNIWEIISIILALIPVIFTIVTIIATILSDIRQKIIREDEENNERVISKR